MTWKKNWNKKNAKPNSKKEKPVIAFHSELSPDVLAYVKSKAEEGLKSSWISQAIEMNYFMETNKREFLSQIITENYNLIKYLVRKIGNEFRTGKI